ncbi:polysaccharide deacetylase family protein [Chitiniphilus purpureus]|uniref:Polysaccharide deacetylase family protein n=1 Tax=Chitiniphilus purpureus TaxID=2981137 RepID=A0ABY6DR02_9NEIS|nr:polysaccharide deacetylase family protein [Chitiniphilus sp. CD1]UXY16797.1 polysaccharide deacetylase family protein [Chitiniphilus sp. CD1]
MMRRTAGWQWLGAGLLALSMMGASAQEQRIRTPYLEGWQQVELATMERQAATFPGVYWIAGPTARKVVALTFDDGPNEGNTLPLLKVLKKHGVRATFFQLGMWVERYPDLARAVQADGHVIGNHSYDHPYSSKLLPSALWEDQVAKTQAIMKKTLGVEPTLYRAPYGEITDEQIKLLTSKGLKVISWSVDTRDWLAARSFNGDSMIERMAMDYINEEAIVLMHDGGGPRQHTVAAVDRMLGLLKRAGYRFITVDELLGVPARLDGPKVEVVPAARATTVTEAVPGK